MALSAEERGYLEQLIDTVIGEVPDLRGVEGGTREQYFRFMKGYSVGRAFSLLILMRGQKGIAAKDIPREDIEEVWNITQRRSKEISDVITDLPDL